MRHDGILDSMVFYNSIYRETAFCKSCAAEISQNAGILPVLHRLRVIRFRGCVWL